MNAEQNNNSAVLNVNVPGADLGELPGIPAVTDAERAALMAAAAAERQAVEANALKRFDTTGFKLEGEIVGRCIKKKVSKNGGVSVGMATKKELGAISGGMKGSELTAFTRMRSDELKAKQSELAARLSGDINWTGAQVKLSAKGDKITLEYKKAEPVQVTLKAEPTDEEMAKLLGITPEAVKAMKLAAKVKAEADAQAAKELADEAAKIAAAAATNGAVHAPEAPQPSDNDGNV